MPPPLQKRSAPVSTTSDAPASKRVCRTRSSPTRSASPDSFGCKPLHRSNRRAAIKLILLLGIQMILCLWCYRRPVLPPVVELRHLPRDHRQLRFLRRSKLTLLVWRVHLSKIPQEYIWWIYLGNHQVISTEPSVFLVDHEVREFDADLQGSFGASRHHHNP